MPAATPLRLPSVKGVVVVLRPHAVEGIARKDTLQTRRSVVEPNRLLHRIYDPSRNEQIFLSGSSQIKYEAATPSSERRFEVLNDSISMVSSVQLEQVVLHEPKPRRTQSSRRTKLGRLIDHALGRKSW